MQFDLNSVEKIKNVFPIFKKVSEEMNCFYLDLNEFVTPSPVDGLHYSKESLPRCIICPTHYYTTIKR